MGTIYFDKKVVSISVLAVFVAGGLGLGITSSGGPHSPTPATSSKKQTGTPSTEAQPHFKTIDFGNLGKPFAQPSLHDDLLVWLGTSKGIQHNPDTVYMMDLKTKLQKPAATTQYTQKSFSLLSPQVNKDWLAWIDSGDNQVGRFENAVYAMNLHTQQVQKVATYLVAHSGISRIDLHNDEVIWSEMADDNRALVKRFNLNTRETTTLTYVATDLSPSVYRSGDKLVWELENPVSKQHDVEVFDLTSRSRLSFQKIDGPYAYPKINSHYVLYSPQHINGSRTELEILDVASDLFTLVPATDHYYWDIGNGFITWSQYENSSSSVYVKTIGDETPPVKLGEGHLPFASDDYVVWASDDYAHVYVTEIKK